MSYNDDIEAAYLRFTTKENELESFFITPCQTPPPTILPSTQEISFIAAYCLLFHACIEEYFETLVKIIATHGHSVYVSDAFLTEHDLDTLSLAKINEKIKQQLHTYLMLANNKNKNLEVDVMSKFAIDNFQAFRASVSEKIEDLKPIETYVIQLLDEAKKKAFSNIEKNTGISFNYTLPLFLAVGIDIYNIVNDPANIHLRESLHALAYHRGSFAHHDLNSTQVVMPILSTNQLIEIKTDCIAFCRELKTLILHRF